MIKKAINVINLRLKVTKEFTCKKIVSLVMSVTVMASWVSWNQIKKCQKSHYENLHFECCSAFFIALSQVLEVYAGKQDGWKWKWKKVDKSLFLSSHAKLICLVFWLKYLHTFATPSLTSVTEFFQFFLFMLTNISFTLLFV